MSKDDAAPPPTGRRKDGLPFAEGNTRNDGSYEVGRGRPPAAGQFRAGDGRSRGRRPKGAPNTDTELERELARKVTVRENGQERRVTKAHAVNLRLIENAMQKGQNRAIELILRRQEQIATRRMDEASRSRAVPDQDLLDRYLSERAAGLAIPAHLLGDPEPGTNTGAAQESSDRPDGSDGGTDGDV